jgi:hypothetical protein
MRRQRRRAQDLRLAIDCLPVRTREAMLEGLDANRIIVGAYVDADGGVCPMLAAHRNGGRTALASFARAWDRYTHAYKGARPATQRELTTLRFMLETSLMGEGHQTELAAAVADLTAAKRRRAREQGLAPAAADPAPRRDTGERDRSRELRHRHGWAWLRIFRRYDTYQAALDELEQHGSRERERELIHN